MNLLGNDRFVSWVCHNGNIVESCLIDDENNGLPTSSQGTSTFGTPTQRQYFRLNEPERGLRGSPFKDLVIRRLQPLI